MKTAPTFVLLYFFITLFDQHGVNAACPCAHRASVIESFYTATNGASWLRPWNMAGVDVPCGLQGVTCDSILSDIIYIVVPSRRLSGTLPDSLGNLTQLVELTLHSNALGGSLPQTLAECTSLLSVNFWNNSLAGTLPPEFSSWTRIQFLSVSSNQFSGSLPKEFSAWGSSLMEFYAEGNKLTGTFPPEYESLFNLRYFRVTSNSFSGTLPPAFSSWTSLIEFNVRVNQLTGSLPKEYSAWRFLKSFICSNNNIDGSLPTEFSAWSSLVHGEVAGNQLTGTLPPEYSSWSLLRSFFISENTLHGVLPASYSSWVSLDAFWAFGNNFTGTLPPEYQSWTKLREFRVYNNHINGTLPPGYGAWTNLLRFECADNVLTGTLPPSYSSWSAVDYVNASNNMLNGTLPLEYRSWAIITTAFLFKNRLSGTLPPEYGDWIQLKHIDIATNYLSGTLPREYAQWKFIFRFQVNSNLFVGSLAPEYSTWSAMLDFGCNENQLSGSLPATYQSWKYVSVFSAYSNSLIGTLPAEYSVWNMLKNFVIQNNSLMGTLPSSYSQWSHLKVFDVRDNLLSGTLPPQFGAWTKLTSCTVDRNDINGTLPSQYAEWVDISIFSCALNSISGTIPASFGRMTTLSQVEFSNNRLTGTIPPSVLLCPELQIFAVGSNELSGTLPPECSIGLSLLSVQHNRMLSGSVPRQMLLSFFSVVSICGTAVACSSSATLTQVCLPTRINFAPRGRMSGADILDLIFRYKSQCTSLTSASTQIILSTRTRRAIEAEKNTQTGAVASDLVTITVFSSFVGGGAFSRGAMASLQRSGAVLRLAAICDPSALAPDFEDDSVQPLFANLDENPLGVALPIDSPTLEYGAGAAVFNAMLVCCVGAVLHSLHVAKLSISRSRLPRSLMRIVTLLPSSSFPGSLSTLFGTLMQPSLQACLLLLVSDERSTASCACGAVMLCVWLAFPVYCVHAVAIGSRSNGVFVLKSETRVNDDSKQQRQRRNVRWTLLRLLDEVRTAQHFLLKPRTTWTVRDNSRHERRRKQQHRAAAKRLLERMEPVFGAYVDCREWFFIVPWGLSITGGVVLGALMAAAADGDNDERCTASMWAAVVALFLGVVEVLLIVVLRPFSVRLEMIATVAVQLLGCVGSALVLAGETAAAGGVVSAAAVLELIAMVMLMLDVLEGTCSKKDRFVDGRLLAEENFVAEKADGHPSAEHSVLAKQRRQVKKGEGCGDNDAETSIQTSRLAELVRVICEIRR
ncbi:GP46-like surface antigen, putative [Bodo saltans]|uniref:GP46-like surface antigen, putative n=1 Tax=Bodo saltans TaxID=75058 RepID=A0A0S4IRK3_BODSA|nr:GP46-like surface antigen, putative [Bodo saltans]|eukprot:CUF43553.1 GP46-like surface antigen, putative [Bodo saltans]